MNKSNFTLFLGRAGSGKTSLIKLFLKTIDLFYEAYYQIILFMPSSSRSSIKDGFFDKKTPSRTNI
jgi:ABC-type multidrug transport system ATPase subunit